MKHTVSAHSETEIVPMSILGVGTPRRASLKLRSGQIASVDRTAPKESADRRIVVSRSGQPKFLGQVLKDKSFACHGIALEVKSKAAEAEGAVAT